MTLQAIATALVGLIRAVRGPFDFGAVRFGSVVRQHADGGVDAKLDDPSWPVVERAELEQGGSVRPGDRVLVSFRDADRKRPIAERAERYAGATR